MTYSKDIVHRFVKTQAQQDLFLVSNQVYRLIITQLNKNVTIRQVMPHSSE